MGSASSSPQQPRIPAGSQWSDLPYEILHLIASRLGIIDLLSFRGVCKDWRSASTAASAESSQTLPRPWFLLYGESPECTLLSGTGKKYSINLPQLDAGVTCIASKNGWLLLLQEQEREVSFLCPFSGARIDLPNIPEAPGSMITGYIATFSSPPTSPDCIVGVLRENAELQIELLILHRGDVSWRGEKLNGRRGNIGTFRAASYDHGIFNFTYHVKGLLTYNDEMKVWERFSIVEVSKGEKPIKSLPFRSIKFQGVRQLLGLPDSVSVSICGTSMKEEKFDKLISNECIVAKQDDKGSELESNRNLKGVWFHPRFFLVPTNHSW